MAGMAIPSDFVLAQARARVASGFAVRAMAMHRAGRSVNDSLANIYAEMKEAENYAREVVKGLDAVPFIEQYVTAEVTNAACNSAPEGTESAMKMREGFAGVLRQLNDKRALVKFGVDNIYGEVVLHFPETEEA